MSIQRVAGCLILGGTFGGMFVAEGLTIGWLAAVVSFGSAVVLVALIILGTELTMR